MLSGHGLSSSAWSRPPDRGRDRQPAGYVCRDAAHGLAGPCARGVRAELGISSCGQLHRVLPADPGSTRPS